MNEFNEIEASEERRQARKDAARAAGRYADAYETTEGGVVTGYVLVVEIIAPSGDPYVVWVTGDGNEPTEDRLGALASWRVDGLARRVIRDVYDQRAASER